MLRRVLGPLDGLLRTLTAFTVYFATKYFESVAGIEIPFLVGEVLAVTAGLAVSGLFSTHLWALPRLTLTWEIDGRPNAGTAVRMRIDDPRQRRIVMHQVSGGPPSLLAKWITRVLDREGLELRLTTTAGIFRITRDSGSVGDVMRANDGFSHSVPTCGREGLIAYVRMEWQPFMPAAPVVCPVSYRLSTRSKRRQLVTRLVLVDARIDQVELIQ